MEEPSNDVEEIRAVKEWETGRERERDIESSIPETARDVNRESEPV